MRNNKSRGLCIKEPINTKRRMTPSSPPPRLRAGRPVTDTRRRSPTTRRENRIPGNHMPAHAKTPDLPAFGEIALNFCHEFGNGATGIVSVTPKALCARGRELTFHVEGPKPDYDEFQHWQLGVCEDCEALTRMFSKHHRRVMGCTNICSASRLQPPSTGPRRKSARGCTAMPHGRVARTSAKLLRPYATGAPRRLPKRSEP